MTRDTDSRRSSRDRDEPEPRRSSRDDDRGSSREEGRRSARDDDRGGRGGGRSDRRSSGSGSSYEYHGRSAADAKKRAAQGANDFDKILVDQIKMWKPNDGDNRIRILPPTFKKPDHYGLDIYVHYGVGPDRQSYLDLDKMRGEPDPITEERAIARRDEDEKYAKELESKRRVLVYLIDRDHEKEGVQAWAMPWTVDRDIVKVSVDKSSGEVLPIDDPDNGYDIEFEKKGAKDRTEYLGVAIARRSSPLGKDEWLDFAVDNPLDEQLNFFSYDHIAKAFNGAGAHKDRSRDDDRSDRRDDRGSSRADDRDRSDRRGGSRDEPESPSRGRGREEPKEAGLTWESIHEMTGAELDDLVDQEKLDINPSEAKDDDDLADWICEEMKLKPGARKEETTSRRSLPKQDDESVADRLARMRGDRDRR